MPVDKLTVEQFAAKIKEKYPVYKDIGDSELVQKVIAKYPVYKEKINFGSNQNGNIKTFSDQTIKLSDIPAQPQQANTNINFNQLNAQHGKVAPSTEQKIASANSGEMMQEKVDKRNEAIDNSLQRKYQQQGKTVSKNSVQYRKDFNDMLNKLHDGDMVQQPAKDGKMFVVKSSGFLENAWKSLVESFKAPIEGFKIMNMDGKELADYLDKKSAEQPYLEESAPSPFLGQLGQAAGGFPKIAGEFAVNEAVPYLGTGIATADAQISSTGQKTQELYQRNLKELTDAGVPLEKARIQAADKAKKDAPIQAIPDAAMTFALGEMGADTKGLNDAANSFKTAIIKSGKSVGKFGILGGVSGAAEKGIEKGQGYDVSMNDVMDNFGKEGFQYATMDAMFKLAPLVAKMPTAMQAEWKSYMGKIPEQIRSENLPEDVNKDINDYSKAEKTIPDHYSDEQKVALSHLIQKKNELNKTTDENFKEDNEPQKEAIDRVIKAVKQNPDNALDFIPDEHTGEHNANAKPFDKLTSQEKDGIVVEKTYGDTDTKEIGEGEEKKYKPIAYYYENKGNLQIKHPIEVGDKTYSDKGKAQEAADKALKQHFYENGLHDFEKPQYKNAPNTTTEEAPQEKQEEIIQPKANEPITTGNEEANKVLPNSSVINEGGEPFNGVSKTTDKHAAYNVTANGEVEIANEQRARVTINSALKDLYNWDEYPDSPTSTITVTKKPKVSFNSEGDATVVSKGQIVWDAEKQKPNTTEQNLTPNKDVLPNQNKVVKGDVSNGMNKYDESEIENFAKTKKFRVSKSNDYTYFDIDENNQIRITKVGGKHNPSYRVTLHHIDPEIGIIGKTTYSKNEHASTLQEAKRVAGKIYYNEIRKDIDPNEKIDILDKQIDYSNVPTDELKKMGEKTNDFSEMAAIKKELDKRKNQPQTKDVLPNVEGSGNVSEGETKEKNNNTSILGSDVDLKGNKKAIEEGRMTANDAKTIIESAGLEVPKDILEKANTENKTQTLNTENNAIQEQSAGSVLQHPQEGVGETGSERGRVESSIEGNETAGTQPEESGEIAGEEEAPMTGIKHAATEEKRQKYGLGEYERNNATDAELESEADEAISKGYNIESLIKKLEDKIPPTGVENFILKKYLAGLEAKFEKNPSDENLAKVQRVYNTLDKIGSLQSEAFRTRKGFVPTDDSKAGFFMNEIAANNDAPLTENQKKVASEEYEKFSKAKEQFEKDKQKFEEEVAQFRAEQELNKTKKSSTRQKKHDDLVKEREQIFTDIKDALRKARGQASATIVPYANELIAIAPHVAKLARNLVEDGVLKLADVVDNIHEKLKEDLPEITKKDIHNIIAGDYNKKQITRKEAAIQFENLRKQAQLLNKLEAEINNEPKTEKAKIKKNQAIEQFKKELGIDKLEQLGSLINRNKTETRKLAEQIKKGDFAPEEKKTPVLEDRELAKRFPNSFQKAKESRDNLLKVKKIIELRRLRQLYENKTPQDKFAIKLTKALNVPRTLMASMDLSAPFRQGFVGTLAHPEIASKSMKFMVNAFKDERIYNAWLHNVHNDPLWETAEKTHLAVTDPNTLHLKDKEEAFLGGNYAEVVPGVAASERAYVGFLNKLRWDLFKYYSDIFESQGKTYDNNPELYKGLASFINSATGRGGMAFGEAASPFLSSVIFSPRLIASRLNMLGLSDIPNLAVRGLTLGRYGVDYGFYTKLPKEIRLLAAKDMLKTVAVGITTLALAKAASNALGGNIQVETDPRSADFGKIRSGDTRWDIWGGFIPYARVIAQFVTGQRKTDKSGVYDIESRYGQNRGDVLLTFGRGKLAPIPSALWDIASKRTVTGDKVDRTFGNPFDNPPNEINLSNEVVSHLIPLVFQDVYDAYKSQGYSALFTVGIPSTFGIGVQTYQPRQSKAKESTSISHVGLHSSKQSQSHSRK